MPRKLSKAQLVRRKLDSLQKFILCRMTEMKAESDWALLGIPIPTGQATPPPWVEKAVRRFHAPIIALQSRLNPAAVQNRTLGSLLELNGMLVGMLGHFDQLCSAVKTDPKIAPDGERLAKALAGQLEILVAPSLKKHERMLGKIAKSGVPASPLQLQKNLAQFQRGTRSVTDSKGRWKGSDKKTWQLCRDMWFHWSALSRLSTAAEIHAAVNDATDGGYSFKLVEKMCTEFGIFAGKRGRRAKKILQSDKSA